MKSHTRNKPFLKIFLTVFISILVVEWFFQIKDYQSLKHRSSLVKPFFGTQYISPQGEKLSFFDSQVKLVLNPLYTVGNLPNQKTAHYQTNSLGFRGKEVSTEQSKRFRIAVLGGSTAFGAGNSGEENTYPGKLEQFFPDSEIFNAGVIGHCSSQELALFVAKIIDLKPDLVITLDGWNDFAQSFYKISGEIDPSNNVLLSSALGDLHFYYFNQRLRSHYLSTNTNPFVRVATNLENMFFPYIRKTRLKNSTIYTLEEVDGLKEYRNKITQVYAANLGKITKIAEGLGAKHLALISPHKMLTVEDSLTTDESKLHVKLRQEFVEQASQSLENSNVSMFDLNNCDDSFSASMFMDNMHLTPDGNYMMAELTAKIVDLQNLYPAEIRFASNKQQRCIEKLVLSRSPQGHSSQQNE